MRIEPRSNMIDVTTVEANAAEGKESSAWNSARRARETVASMSRSSSTDQIEHMKSFGGGGGGGGAFLLADEAGGTGVVDRFVVGDCAERIIAPSNSEAS